MMEIKLTIDATPALLDALTGMTGVLRGLSTPAQHTPQTSQSAASAPSVAQQPPMPQVPPVTPIVPQAPAPAAAVPTTAPDYTQDQLSRAASAYIDKSPANLAQLRGLLQQFGVQAVSQLATPEARTAFANALRGLGAQV